MESEKRGVARLQDRSQLKGRFYAAPRRLRLFTPPSAVYIAVVLMSLPQVNHLSPRHNIFGRLYSVLSFAIHHGWKLVFNRALIVYPIGPPFLSRL